MAVREYVGARYVPKFADPVEWQENTAYEGLTIVTYNNTSYTSKKPVPATVGTPKNNSEYWAKTGDYNAQVEQYRQDISKAIDEVEDIKDDVQKVSDDFDARVTTALGEVADAKKDATDTIAADKKDATDAIAADKADALQAIADATDDITKGLETEKAERVAGDTQLESEITNANAVSQANGVAIAALQQKFNESTPVYTDTSKSANGLYVNMDGDGFNGEKATFNILDGALTIEKNRQNSVLRVMTLNAPNETVWDNNKNNFSVTAMTDFYMLLASYGCNLYALQEIYSVNGLPFPTGIINHQYQQDLWRNYATNYKFAFMKNGNLVAAHEAITTKEALYANVTGLPRGYINVTTTYNGKSVSMYNTHLSTSNNAGLAEQELTELGTVLDNDTASVQIVAGDFNFNTDVYSFNSFYAPLISRGFSPANTGTNTWPRTDAKYPTDNIWFKGCSLENVQYVRAMPSSLADFDHVGIVADLTV